MTTKCIYEAPELTALEVNLEEGIAQSSRTEGLDFTNNDDFWL